MQRKTQPHSVFEQGCVWCTKNIKKFLFKEKFIIKPTQILKDLMYEYKQKFGHCPVMFWNPIGVRVPSNVTNEELEKNRENKDYKRKIYHVSKTPNLTILEPRICSHNKAYVYVSYHLETALLFGGNFGVIGILFTREIMIQVS